MTSPRLIPTRNSIRFSGGSPHYARPSPLHLHRAAHRVDNAGKFCEQAVAGRLDDPAMVFGDLRINSPLGVPSAVRASLLIHPIRRE